VEFAAGTAGVAAPTAGFSSAAINTNDAETIATAQIKRRRIPRQRTGEVLAEKGRGIVLN
jgi:hypothetical protein